MKSILIKSLLILISYGIISPAYAEKANENEALDSKQQSIVTIAAFTAIGDLESLAKALNVGLEAGLTVNQIKEVMVHLYAYAGFPRSLRGLQTFITVLDERKQKGIEDEWGAEASAITDERSKYERGKAILEELTGVSQDGPKRGYAAFSPEVEVFLKEHLFADIFERDVLTYQQREMVTVSVLISLGGLEPMLRSHMNICLYQGIAPNQLKELITIGKKHVGSKKAEAAEKVLNELLEEKN